MLVDAKMPHKFWAEALSTAVYLKNRSPTKAVKGMTPFEAWTGKKRKVGHLRAFGCVAYAHVPRTLMYRRTKDKTRPESKEVYFPRLW